MNINLLSFIVVNFFNLSSILRLILLSFPYTQNSPSEFDSLSLSNTKIKVGCLLRPTFILEQVTRVELAGNSLGSCRHTARRHLQL